MIVGNHREARAEPVTREPGVAACRLVRRLDQAPNLALRLYEMETGATTTAQSHYWRHEVFAGSGRGVMAGEGGEIPPGEGDVVYVPPKEHHRFVNHGDEMLRFLVVLPIVHQTPVQVG